MMMPGHVIVVLGASAGGVEVLSQLVRRLPANFPAASFVVPHVPAHSPSLLPRILERNGPLPARHPSDGEAIERGRTSIAPPDQHLLPEGGRVRLVRGPRENGHRPAVDPLLRTVAPAFGPRVVGVVLSGNLDDGTAGLAAIKQRGGLTVVQDPEEGVYPGMPRNAIESVAVDHILPAARIAELLDRLTRQPSADEVRGRNLLSLDIGLPVVRLEPALLACFSGEVPHRGIVLEATIRRGKAIH